MAAALELLSMHRPYRRIHKIVDDYLEDHVTQRTDAIDKLFLSYGLTNFCEHVRKKTGRVNLQKSINSLIARRHKIVHTADVNKHGSIQAISLTSVKRQVSDVATFVQAADLIASNVLSQAPKKSKGQPKRVLQ